jgi:hypothetical protein
MHIPAKFQRFPLPTPPKKAGLCLIIAKITRRKMIKAAPQKTQERLYYWLKVGYVQ